MTKINLALFASLLATSSCGASALEGSKSGIEWGSDEFHSVYEASATLRRGMDSRIDFDRLHHALHGIHFTVSGIDDTPAERAKSDLGGIALFTESDKYFSMEGFPVYVPKGSVQSWTGRGVKCTSNSPNDAKRRIECVGEKTGLKYSALYSEGRGFEWFENDCEAAPNRVCRYVLRSGSGLLSRSMITKLQSLGLFKRI